MTAPILPPHPKWGAACEAYAYMRDDGTRAVQAKYRNGADSPKNCAWWIEGTDGVYYPSHGDVKLERLRPYNSSLLNNPRSRHELIVVCEGPKDADALVGLGFVASDHRSLVPAHAEWYRGRDVVIVQDRDPRSTATNGGGYRDHRSGKHTPGERAATKAKRILLPVARRLAVIEMPGAGVKDAAQWVALQTGAPADKATVLRAMFDHALACGDGAYAEPEPAASLAPDPVPWPTGINYPDELWGARPWLSELRNYAIARTLDADLLLGACLARFAALLPKGTAMDTGIMSGQASLNLLVAAIGPSGRGKSCAIEAAEHIVPAPEDVDIAEGAIGSGQGIAEAFMGDVCPNPDAPKKDRKIERKQVRHNAYLWLDEGQTLTRLAQQANNITMPTLRSAAMGASLGALNATAERRRKVKGYNLGVFIGYQPCTVGPLLAEVAEGTPQRFLFCAIGQAPDADADGYAYPVLDRPPSHVPVTFVEALRQEIRARHCERLRNTLMAAGPDWHSHAILLQCKVAALLCVIDHRQIVTRDDWHLADIICDTSHAIVRWLREEEARQREAEDLARIAARAAGAQAAAVAVQQAPAKTDALARRLAAKVHEQGRISKGDARANFFRSTVRHLFAAACDAAADMGWIIVEENHVAPGPARPA
jgi:hypothetical protein